MQKLKSYIPPCCGIIVFDQDRTILVSTYCGNFSFPKGKRKKRENDLETAWRELEEETGLTSSNVSLIDNFYIDENSSKGNPAIRYFVGFIKKTAPDITFNPKELADVSWVSIQKALTTEKFKVVRKDVLAMAHKEYLKVTF